MTAVAEVRAHVADPVLVLADVVARLRLGGAGLQTDRVAMGEAYRHLTAALGALGVPTDAGELAETDWRLLRCVAARRS